MAEYAFCSVQKKKKVKVMSSAIPQSVLLLLICKLNEHKHICLT